MSAEESSCGECIAYGVMFRIKDEKKRAAVIELFGEEAAVARPRRLALIVQAQWGPLEEPFVEFIKYEGVAPSGWHQYPAEKPLRAGRYEAMRGFGIEAIRGRYLFDGESWSKYDKDIFAWKELEK